MPRVRAALPMVDPILPHLRREIPIGTDWRYEVKLDGFRGVLYVDGEQAWFRSKTGNTMRRFATLAQRVRETLRVRTAVLDGEIVVFRDGLPDFNALFRSAAAPSYAAFDVLFLDGRDLRAMPYRKRKERLRSLLTDLPPSGVSFVESFDDPSLLAAAERLDLEGVVAKRARDPYSLDTVWVKVKHAEYTQAVGRADLFHRRR